MLPQNMTDSELLSMIDAEFWANPLIMDLVGRYEDGVSLWDTKQNAIEVLESENEELKDEVRELKDKLKEIEKVIRA